MNTDAPGKFRKKRKSKFNNPHKVPNEKASEIWSLANEKLIEEVDLHYRNWQAVNSQKKSDPQVENLKDQKVNILNEIISHPKYVEAENNFQKIKEELITEEFERIKEELKNILEPYKEDIEHFRGLFRVCMDELNNRIQKGLINNR
jgi:hypothetical protein